jgi:hypothetical protein
MVQKGQKDPRSRLGNATGRDELGCREGLSDRSSKGDDAASARLVVARTVKTIRGGRRGGIEAIFRARRVVTLFGTIERHSVCTMMVKEIR